MKYNALNVGDTFTFDIENSPNRQEHNCNPTEVCTVVASNFPLHPLAYTKPDWPKGRYLFMMNDTVNKKGFQ